MSRKVQEEAGSRDEQQTPQRTVPLEIARRILQTIEGLGFGSVEIIVHDGRIVQIERKEKVRVDRL
jgi:hypothetical protein